MKIVITTKKRVLTAQGALPKNVPVDVEDSLAAMLIERGEASAMETKAPVTDDNVEVKRRGRPAKV